MAPTGKTRGVRRGQSERTSQREGKPSEPVQWKKHPRVGQANKVHKGRRRGGKHRHLLQENL
ncbi:hypothetical protein PVIIG_06581 [Plasmodium vivax India VII]|uniref:Uncharacterized protein n=1 Tax=Plasmodium vivax India VII TaxID=1077284 RepID=A0A0J9V4X8_PLAVI|nr:hypothetical protein PVIIG_06581 [Plasmodium vivax India VII]